MNKIYNKVNFYSILSVIFSKRYTFTSENVRISRLHLLDLVFDTFTSCLLQMKSKFYHSQELKMPKKWNTKEISSYSFILPHVDLVTSKCLIFDSRIGWMLFVTCLYKMSVWKCQIVHMKCENCKQICQYFDVHAALQTKRKKRGAM